MSLLLVYFSFRYLRVMATMMRMVTSLCGLRYFGHLQLLVRNGQSLKFMALMTKMTQEKESVWINVRAFILSSGIYNVI